jgi:hypothetical protein
MIDHCPFVVEAVSSLRVGRSLPRLVAVLGGVCLWALVAAGGRASAQTPDTTARYTIDVDGQPAPTALDHFAARTGIDLIYATDLVAGHPLRCRIDRATPREGLACLLRGTGIVAERRGPGRYVLRARRTPNRHVLSGFVVDAESGESLVGANVYAPALERGTATNEHGFYSLTLPADSVRLVVSYLGYRNRAVAVDLHADRRRTIALEPTPVRAGSLEVSDRRRPLQRTTRTSTIDVSAAEVEAMPTLLGQPDLLKTFQRMPGVQSGPEGTSGLYVRGGTPDQNLILLDGAPLYNVSHAFGFLSVFNPDIIQGARITKGGFPARYGGHLSSVVEVTVEDGNRKEYDVEGSVGLVSSRLAVQGPIIEDKTSFLLAGRRTYADLLIRPFVEGGLDGGFYFYDVNAKLNHQFSASDRVFWSLYTGDDTFYSRDGDAARFDLGWGNLTSTLRWTHVFGGRLFGSATLRYSRYRFGTSATEEGGDGSTYRLRYRSGIRDWGLQVDLDYDPTPRHTLRMGLDGTYHRFRPGATQYRNDDGGTAPLDTTVAPSDPVRALDASAYVEDDVTWTDRLKTNLGLRAAGFFVEGSTYLSLQPRLSARYLLPGDWALKGSYAWMRQPIHLLTSSSVGLPTDLWVSSTEEVPPERSHQVVLGLSRSFREQGLETRLEAYGKTMEGLIEYEQGAAFQLATDTNWEEQIETGRGWSYGLELLVRRTTGRTTGWVGYTLSWTRRQFDALNDGDPFPFRYDRRHNLTVTASHQLTDVTSLTATWTYRTGPATTLPRGRYRAGDVGAGDQVSGYTYNELSGTIFGSAESYGPRNGYRLRPYHRLDLGADFAWGEPDDRHALKVGAYNAYNRKNPYFLRTKRTGTGAVRAEAVTLLPMVPYVNYRFKF